MHTEMKLTHLNLKKQKKNPQHTFNTLELLAMCKYYDVNFKSIKLCLLKIALNQIMSLPLLLLCTCPVQQCHQNQSLIVFLFFFKVVIKITFVT